MNPTHIDDFRLNEFVDGVLTSAESLAVETHLSECATCRQKVAELRRLFTQFETWVEAEILETSPSPNFAANVLSAIAARSLAPAPLPWKALLAQVVFAMGLFVLLGSLLTQVVNRWLAQLALPLWQTQPIFWSTKWGDLIEMGSVYWANIQQQSVTWLQLLQPPALPVISLSIWLPLLLMSCLLWLVVTRWLVLTNE